MFWINYQANGGDSPPTLVLEMRLLRLFSRKLAQKEQTQNMQVLGGYSLATDYQRVDSTGGAHGPMGEAT